MTYPRKAMWLTSTGFTALSANDDEGFQYCVDHGWELVIVSIWMSEVGWAADWNSNRTYAEKCDEYGIPFWWNVEQLWKDQDGGHVPGDHGTVPSPALFSDAIEDAIAAANPSGLRVVTPAQWGAARGWNGTTDWGSDVEEMIDVLSSADGTAGFTFETAFDGAVDYLRGFLDANYPNLLIRNILALDPATELPPNPAPIYLRRNGYPSDTLTRRISLVDEIVSECISLDIFAWADDMITYLQGASSVGSGCRTVTDGDNLVFQWWGDTYGAGPYLAQEVQEDRAVSHFAALQATVGDIMIQEVQGRCDLYTLQFYDSLNVQAQYPSIPLIVYEMDQEGIVPSYSELGISNCSPDAPVIVSDTFANTGKEILLLKNPGSGDVVHEISVGWKDYTITVPSERGIPLGPFPVRLFGDNPVIVYDNADLEVTVMKSVPYSQQT